MRPIVLEDRPRRSPAMRGGVFLDRDGVLIENRADYVRATSDVRMLPGAAEAVRLLGAAGRAVVVITNQAVIGRGLVDAATIIDVHRHVLDQLAAQSAHVDASFLCPHAPDDGCPCRKPAPGMITSAASRLGIDLGRSVVIGDAATDLSAAYAVSMSAALVLTGRGRDQLRLCRAQGVRPHAVFPCLGAAVGWARERTGEGNRTSTRSSSRAHQKGQ